MKGDAEGGIEQLRHERQRLDEALRAFDAPIADELPGLRLMRRTLAERHAKVVDYLDMLEHCHLDVRVGSDALGGDGLPAALATELLGALQDGVTNLALEVAAAWSEAPRDDVVRAEVQLTVESWTGGPPVELGLRFPRLPDEQLVDPATRTPLVARVLEQLIAAADGARPVPALARLAELVVARAVTLDLAAVMVGGAQRDASLDRAAAQRLLLEDSATAS